MQTMSLRIALKIQPMEAGSVFIGIRQRILPVYLVNEVEIQPRFLGGLPVAFKERKKNETSKTFYSSSIS